MRGRVGRFIACSAVIAAALALVDSENAAAMIGRGRGSSWARIRRKVTLATLIAGASVAFFAAGAHAFIYWADSQNQTIGRAGNDGTGVDDSFIPTGQLPFAVAVDASHIYWANQNSNSIGRANIDGTGVNNSFITGVTDPTGVAVNGASIYWSTLAGQIGKASLSGAGKQPSFIGGLVEPCGVALDSGHVYWVEIASGTPAYIARAGLDGSVVQLNYVTIPGTSFPCGVAVNSANIFWSRCRILRPWNEDRPRQHQQRAPVPTRALSLAPARPAALPLTALRTSTGPMPKLARSPAPTRTELRLTRAS